MRVICVSDLLMVVTDWTRDYVDDSIRTIIEIELSLDARLSFFLLFRHSDGPSLIGSRCLLLTMT